MGCPRQRQPWTPCPEALLRDLVDGSSAFQIDPLRSGASWPVCHEAAHQSGVPNEDTSSKEATIRPKLSANSLSEHDRYTRGASPPALSLIAAGRNSGLREVTTPLPPWKEERRKSP